MLAHLDVDVDHPLRSMLSAEKRTSRTFDRVRWSLVAALVTARLSFDVDHPLLGVLSTEQGLFGTVHPMRRLLLAALATAGYASDVNHSRRGMWGTVQGRFRAGDAPRRLFGAVRIAAPPLPPNHKLDRPFRSMLRAEPGPFDAGQSIHWNRGAALVVTPPPVDDADHSLRGVLSTEQGLVSAEQPIRWSFRAAFVPTHSADDVDHTMRCVFRTELGTFGTGQSIRWRLRAVFVLTSSADDVHHTSRCVMRAGLGRPSVGSVSAGHAIGRLPGATFMVTPLHVDVDHPYLSMSGAKQGSSGTAHAETRYLGTAIVTALHAHPFDCSCCLGALHPTPTWRLKHPTNSLACLRGRLVLRHYCCNTKHGWILQVLRQVMRDGKAGWASATQHLVSAPVRRAVRKKRRLRNSLGTVDTTSEEVCGWNANAPNGQGDNTAVHWYKGRPRVEA